MENKKGWDRLEWDGNTWVAVPYEPEEKENKEAGGSSPREKCPDNWEETTGSFLDVPSNTLYVRRV